MASVRLREEIRRRFGPQLAEQPLAALVNVALPEESRILQAPLAAEAGGWGLWPEAGMAQCRGTQLHPHA